MKEKLFIPCSFCKGSGRVEFTGVYADTFRFLQKQNEALNGAELARKSGVNVTAMENRLVWLEAHGFAVCERYGQKKIWRAV